MDKKGNKPKPWATIKLPEIEKDVKEKMSDFFLEIFSLGTVMMLIFLIIFLKIAEAFGIISINVPFL